MESPEQCTTQRQHEILIGQPIYGIQKRDAANVLAILLNGEINSDYPSP
jgi:hypothetical protein